MWVRLTVATALLFLPTAVDAQVEKRIAVLIGNRSYDASVGVLKNPHNRRRIAQQTRVRGFTTHQRCST
jgi:hypothetical protein